MKIECTRDEWNYFHSLLLIGNNTSETYFKQNCECKVYCSKTGYLFTHIHVNFKEEDDIEKTLNELIEKEKERNENK